MTFTRPEISRRAAAAPRSGIGEIVAYARGRDNLMPLWIGEGDLPTPTFISDAAGDALRAGETFYTWTQGIPELRQALVRYYQRHYATSLSADNMYVTGSGMQAIVLALQAVASAGDEVIYLTPAWPNVVNAMTVSEVNPVGVELTFDDGRWSLDIDRLAAAITPRTKALFVNTPPTRQAGRRPARISQRWCSSPVSMASGSSQTRSMAFTITPAREPRPSSMSWMRKTVSSSPTPSRRTGA